MISYEISGETIYRAEEDAGTRGQTSINSATEGQKYLWENEVVGEHIFGSKL